jgi:uncharacterized protein (TIGR02099 family)
MRLLLNRSLRLAWFGAAAVLVLMATASVALRLALPRLDAQRPAIERWISDLTGVPVTVGNLGAGWRGAFPSLTADGVVVQSATDTAEALRFERAEVEVALLESLRRRDIVLGRVLLSGIKLTVQRDTTGRYSIVGIPPRRSTFIDWLLRQRDIAVERAEVVFEDHLRDSPPRRFSGLALRLQGGRTAVLRGVIDDDSVFGTTPQFELHLPRDRTLPGELRLALKGVAPGPLLEFAGLRAAAAPVVSVDGSLWLRWQDGRLRRIAVDAQGRLAPTRSATAPGSVRLAAVASATAAAWHVRVASLTPAPSAGPLPAYSGLLTVRHNADGYAVDATAGTLALDLIDLLGDSVPALPVVVRGELQQLRFALRRPNAAPAAFYLAAGVTHGSLGARAPLPAIGNLSAGLAVNRDRGALAFDNDRLVIEEGERLGAALPFDGLTGVTRWQRSADGWLIATPDLRGSASAIPFALDGSADLATGRRPRIDAALEIGAADVSRLQRLLPQGVLRERAELWFRRAFHSGRLERARAELRGDLADFPFDAGNGLFNVEFDVADTTLEYSAKWPVIEGVAAHGAIAGRKFAADIRESRFFDAPGRDLRVSIADLFSRKPVLLATGTVRATLADTLKTIEQSPLSAGPARRLKDIQLDGEFDLALDLNIGLKQGEERTALGIVTFDGNTLRTTRDKLALEDLRGKVSFTREDWYGEDLTALYEGQRVGLVVNGGIGDPNYDTEFRMTGTSDAAQLRAYLLRYAPYLHAWLARNQKLEALHGEVPWKAVLSLPHVAAGEPPAAKKLLIESSLAGLGVDLPWPFGKVAAEQKPLSIDTVVGGGAARTTRLSFGDAVRFELDQDAPGADGKAPITRADIAFGRGESAATQPGIYLHGELASLPLAEWARLLKDAATPQSPTAALPIAFDVRVKQVDTLGQRFSDVAFKGRKDSNAWRIAMDSERAQGDITVPLDMQAAPLTLNLRRLWLDKVESGGKRTVIDPRRIPAVALACESFKYGTVDFGQASLSTARTSEGQKLESLVFTNPAFQVSVTGEWLLRDAQHRSQFSIDLKGKSLGDVLSTFGYAATNIEDGRTELAVEATWVGMPSEFTLDRLDGSLGLKVRKGRFLDIEPGGGRLFGLLSLQTLPRRLSLDFSDLFQKGFAFDRIEGWFELEKGNAYTNSLLMEGPSAKVEISGRTGLAAKDYDQRAVVTPALSDSIPLASAFFGPAGIGVGAAIYLGQKVFKQVPEQVDRFLRREYAITGPWSDPLIEKR